MTPQKPSVIEVPVRTADAVAPATERVTARPHEGLGQLASTSICGNDITSSCLYVSALAIIYAGRWAPVALLLVAFVLYLFRSIYAEVVGALPLLLGVAFVAVHGLDTLRLNLATPSEEGVTAALFFGFSAALLGISGFESSANFVEEQSDAVFPKTLRNMWVAVSFFNPAMALLALALVPISEVASHEEALLAHMGLTSGQGGYGRQ